ncbi:HAD hydrolase, family IA, variant 3 [Streptomyces graminofaciens]|uniref:HAD hydrolase, family IA, variant 3 n=1 Tax=Streptomyces graminofaciens TaxID=68212 RepID=A0ABM7FKH8_9ACTN|nr:HAD family hydrolase [Streptomyces graminofaciens]BBC36802.1 HAD hydrolase, family IA, variant 3 [Streptomyces graminofaciens]
MTAAVPTQPTVLTARALLLDMDGTLVNSDAAVERVWRRWAERHGLAGDEVIKVVHGRQGYATMAVLLPDRPMEQNLADNKRLLAEETADVDGVVPIPGAPEFLASLAEVPHALVTSADVALSTARMGAAGLPLPAVRITAESVGASKPDPEGFLKGAAELGVAPEDCVVFEDSEAGIVAGRAAGMRVVGVGERAGLYGPDVLVADLGGVRVEAAGGGVVVRLWVG